MTAYIIRPGFTISKGNLIYSGGQSIDLTPLEFAENKHKLEGVSTTVAPIIYNVTFNGGAQFDDTNTNLVTGEDKVALQVAIEALDARLDSSRKKLKQNLSITVSLDGSADFTTIQAALDSIEKDLDSGGCELIVSIAEGDYTSEGLLHLPPITGGKAETCGPNPSSLPPNPQIRIVGSGTSKTLVAGFELDCPAYYSLEDLGFKLNNGGASLVKSQRGGVIELSNAFFEGSNNMAGDAVVANDGGLIYLSKNIYFHSSFTSVFKASSRSQIKMLPDRNCSIFTSQNLNPQYFFAVEDLSTLTLDTAIFNLYYDAAPET